MRSAQIFLFSWDAEAKPLTKDRAIVFPGCETASALPRNSKFGSAPSMICIFSLQRLIEKSSAKSKRRATWTWESISELSGRQSEVSQSSQKSG